MQNIFNLALTNQKWFEEEGVDEEEIKKVTLDQIFQKYNE